MNYHIFRIREGLIAVDCLASHFDHSRDLLHLINVKRDDIQHPIVGIGHSAGCLSLFVFYPVAAQIIRLIDFFTGLTLVSCIHGYFTPLSSSNPR